MIERNAVTISSRLPGHLIRRLHQRSTQVFADRVREAGHDLTPVQFAALDALRHHPGIDQAGLARAAGKDRATIGAVVDRLESKGLLSRSVSPQDKRARVLELTQEGERIIEALIPIVEKFQQEILCGLDANEYRQFIQLAAKATKTDRADP